MISASGAQFIRFALENGKETPAFTLDAPLQDQPFSIGANSVAVVNGNSVQMMDANTGKVHSRAEAPGSVTAIALSADGLYMAAGYVTGNGSMISVFTTHDGKEASKAIRYRYGVQTFAVSQGGLKVAAATQDNCTYSM